MHQFQIFEASFNYIGEVFIKEYQENKSKEINNKIKCINNMYMYTHMLKADYDILTKKYNKKEFDLNKKIQMLQNKLDDANNLIRFKNLGSKRFTDQNEK